MEEGRWIGVCGLDCGSCDVRRLPVDDAAAERVVAWFRQMEWLAPDEGVAEVLERGMYCRGCRGDRTIHWSPDCWILQCCVDERGLAHCSQCVEFPCDRLQEWAQGSARYREALARLEGMRS